MKKIIRIIDSAPCVTEDQWEVIRSDAGAGEGNAGNAIVPFSQFMAMDEVHAARVRAIWLSPDDEFEASIDLLSHLEMIAIDFPTFRDGRGYSMAKLLRTRYGWTRELRAIGDVLRDQLNYMRRCGFDTFAVRADKDPHDALKSFDLYSVTYQGSVDNPDPLFKRRHHT